MYYFKFCTEGVLWRHIQASHKGYLKPVYTSWVPTLSTTIHKTVHHVIQNCQCLVSLIPVTSKVILGFSKLKLVIDTYYEFKYTKRNEKNVYLLLLSNCLPILHNCHGFSFWPIKSKKLALKNVNYSCLLLLFLFSFHFSFWISNECNISGVSLWRVKHKYLFSNFCF